MCGIAGMISDKRIDRDILQDMIHVLRHRGPDDTGCYIDGNVGLGHCRLGIMDPVNGRQPIMNEDETIVVIFNGEIFNHRQLGESLACKGHILANHSDSAILPHMFEEYGTEMFEKLNGQFAIAIWSKTDRKLVLARDRLGEKPLYYYRKNGILCFGSEAKAIFKSGMVDPVISPSALKQVFTLWTTHSCQSVFQDINQLPPACCLTFENGEAMISRYWEITFSADTNTLQEGMDFDALTERYADELEKKLRNSIKMRMMSDVPISFYLSGGLDSSLIAAMAADITGSRRRLNTFSIAFNDSNFDESVYQDKMSRYLGSEHRTVRFSRGDIPLVLKDVIHHSEMPLLRSGPFPMYVLAKLVSDNNTKVVLSGEGSDELFGGYDIFREVKIREYCSKYPESGRRASLYKSINRFVRNLDRQPANSLALFYGGVAADQWCSSHDTRWRLGNYSRQFFSMCFREEMDKTDVLGQTRELLPEDFMEWSSLQRAQYLEIILLFSNYLLSSQGDRVSMASSVECRFPFLDHEVIELACRLPDRMKIKVLDEKYIIKRIARKYLPEEILNRQKFPYRAPIDIPGLMVDEHVRELVSAERIDQYGIFDPGPVKRMLTSILAKPNPSERDNMIFMGIVTTQMLYEQFIA